MDFCHGDLHWYRNTTTDKIHHVIWQHKVDNRARDDNISEVGVRYVKALWICL